MANRLVYVYEDLLFFAQPSHLREQSLQKFYLSNLHYLQNQGRFYLVYWRRGPTIVFGEHDRVRMHYFHQNHSPQIEIKPLRLTEKEPDPVIECYRCNGRGLEDIEVELMVLTEYCSLCYGLGRIDFDDRSGVDR